MTVDLLLTGISHLATPFTVFPDAAIAVHQGRIAWRGPAADWTGDAVQRQDLGGVAVVPALIDPHTHAVWAGDRLADFEARCSGIGYEQVLEGGGGIRSTVRATAAASLNELVALAQPRIQALVSSGAATIEIKSGYGLDPAAELRMLEAIAALAKLTPARLIPTLLIHIPPSDPAVRKAYAAHVCCELIPEVVRRGLAHALDIFVEREAWSAEEARAMVHAAHQHGLPFKLHAEQFHRVGGVELCIEEGAMSVDHLEACVPAQISALAASHVVATILPGVTLHLGIPAAPGRALLDAGATVAVGTDLNPGSSPLYSVSEALSLAVRLNHLQPLEALIAGTASAAAALRLNDCGRIEPGFRADFAVLDGRDWRDLVYSLGRNPVRQTWIAGSPA